MRFAVLIAAVFAATPAAAQDIDAQRFRPAADAWHFAKLVEPDPRDDGTWGAALWFGVTDDPFVYRPAGELVEVPILDTVASVDVTGFYNVNRLRIGLHMPVHLWATGFDLTGPTHPGDLRLSARYSVFDSDDNALGIVLGGSLPTGSARNYLGAGMFGVEGLIAARQRIGPVDAVLNMGLRSGNGSVIGTELVSSVAVPWGVGAALPVGDSASVAVEVDGELWLKSLGHPGATPAEWLVSMRTSPSSSTMVSAGFGTGFTRGIGAPDFRVVAAFTVSPGLLDQAR